jgi:putative transcriptional regulator
MGTDAKPQAKSRILDAVHETASDLQRLGFIDKRKQQKLDVLCLESIPPYDSERIRALREYLKLSQTVLASVLNTSASTVRKWGVGEKHPSGPSLKLLTCWSARGWMRCCEVDAGGLGLCEGTVFLP